MLVRLALIIFPGLLAASAIKSFWESYGGSTVALWLSLSSIAVVVLAASAFVVINRSREVNP